MAENELARFQYEPLKSSPLAPLAMIRLSEAMRSTRRSEAAVKLLADVARRPELVTTDAARHLVGDRVVASQVEVALAGHPDMRRYRIDVESTRGLVTLDLPAGVDPDVAVAVARGVTGVENVKLRIAEMPVVTPFPG